MNSSSVPMSWVWERFKNTFRSSVDDDAEDVDTERRSCHNREVSVYGTPHEVDDTGTTGREESVTTCTACKVTIHHHQQPGPRLRAACPFCGQPYIAATTIVQRTEHQPVGVGVGAGRVHGQRSCSDPILPSFRLPAIEPSPEQRTPRYGRIGSFMVSRLGNVNITTLGNFLLRPGSETSLPPISKDCDGKSCGLALSPASTPESGFRSVLSVENLTCSEPEEVRDIPQYPTWRKTREEFLQDVRRAQQTENYTSLQRFYMRCFNTFAEICALFKMNKDEEGAKLEEPGLNMEFLYAVHDTLREMPSIIHKTVLKSIINALLEENRMLYDKDDVRALFVLVQNPVFAAQSSYTIFAHLLRQIVNQSSTDHHLLVNWFKQLEVEKLRMIVRHVMQFITIRQFPPADKSLPPMSKSRWWIPTGTKTLALINAANNSSTPPLLDYTEFYNSALDHMDLMQDYFNWQSPQRPGQFSYCQYPFILSIVAKRIILTKDSEQQMILTARRSLVAKVARHQAPQIDIFFLNIHVRRSHLVSDSLNEIASKQKDLKKKLKVSFVGEPGLDMGGLTKEWFLLLIRQIFHPDYGMFVYHPNSRCYWFSTDQEGNLREYNLIGVLMGLAVYNSIILDLHFPSICYRKLLSPPVVPDVDTSDVGSVKTPTVDDLAEIMPDVSRGLTELLAYEGNVEEDMCMSFQVSLEEYGDVKTYKLKDSGENIPVTNENRKEYVQLYLDWILNAAIYEQFRAFYLGFHSVCASNALIMLRPEEVEMLVCGSPTLDLNELRKVTEYDGYKADDPIIIDFWEVLHSLSDELKKKFLLFATGSDRVPVGGMGEMTFKITKVTNKPDNLPEAHTCFNQLVLPTYENEDLLRQKLIIAISNAEGFGLE
ncbi:probable E3 ubiquitin-protein ligase HECTD2 isoform X2 [Zootermopsis nevadensis]|uniref:probable E3 ubiquitin-protein ligase HECTD2 isoform X2 n=1 Tax=Zootermopsis nevadensis TaxID=136037 RepID=UPI000B8E4427|nr:probable E3 ubiquitin-protein ligase HECTD2 isoform X2 [Zootermopsis nevadensis]